MQLHNTNEMKSNSLNHSSLSSTTSCSTNSTDSGVIIIDNKTKFSSNKANNWQTHGESKNIEHEKRNYSLRKGKPNHCNINIDNTFNINSNNNNNINNNKSNNNNSNSSSSSNSNSNSNKNNYHNNNNISSSTPNFNSTKNGSPTFSIRSTTISIESIDENAIDSSVIDSDSDIEGSVGENDKYIIKRLGQQTTYPAHSTDIPTINKGVTVVSQKITQNDNGQMIGGNIAENILKGNLKVPNFSADTVPASNAPQIGSIALSNSTDVTFGDKHFYEGPVTIQQFVIDSRNKQKESEQQGQDNPGYDGDGMQTNGSKTCHTHADQRKSSLKCGFRQKKMPCIYACVLGLIAFGVIVELTTDLFHKAAKKKDYIFDGSLILLNYADWKGRPPKRKLNELDLPAHRVIISHTATESCFNMEVCSYRARVIQAYHMDSYSWDDVGYNFMIGGDGLVYAGRGWDYEGAHTLGYNNDSIGISFIGIFTKMLPTEQQLNATHLLLDEGVRLKKLSENYRLYGHRQLSATESPGERLYRIIKTWPHWTADINIEN